MPGSRTPEGFRSPESARERVWTYDRLKERIVEACKPERFHSGLSSFEDLPDEMSVGRFGLKALECVRAGAADGKERASVLRFNPAKRVSEIQRGLAVGTESGVEAVFAMQRAGDERNFLDLLTRSSLERSANFIVAQRLIRTRVARLNVQEALREDTEVGRAVRQLYTRWIGTVHSHPADSSFSPVDIASFLSSPTRLIDLVGTKKEEIHVLAATADTKWIPEAEQSSRAKRWIEMVNTRVRDAQRDTIQAFRDQDLVHRDALRAFVRSMANRYKFGYYVGDAVSPLKRVS